MDSGLGMAVLREVKGEQLFPLNRKVTVLGRDPACDILVNQSTTSARHAIIVNSGGVFYLEDLDSVNGTYLNGQRIAQCTRLQPGDLLEIPGLSVRFQTELPPAKIPRDSTLSYETLTATVSVLSALDPSADPRPAVKAEAKLRAVLRISNDLSNTLDVKVVLPRILESLFAIFPSADCGFILVNDSATGQLVPEARKDPRTPAGKPAEFSRSIVDHVLKTRQAVLSVDAGADIRFSHAQSIQHQRIRSVMCVPMLSQTGACQGIIQLDTRDLRNRFTQEDLDLLVCAGILASRAVELAHLHEVQREWQAATRIQKSFLPSERPRYTGLQFYDYYSPAQHVGGDYYDYIPLPGNRLAVALGDVAGKGISAALLMARLSAAARFCLATTATAPEAMRQLNALLTRSESDDRFVTLLLAVLDLERFQLTLSNAGHMPPLRRRANRTEVEELGEEIIGLPLAVMDRPYEQIVVPFEPGDVLVLYTDGLSEARSPEGELFGPERVRAAVQQAPPDPEALGQALLGDVQRFARTRPLGDDLTIVSFGRTPATAGQQPG